MKNVRQEIEKLINNITSIVYIDRRKLEYIIAAKIAGGHVMLADSHGVGKTSLARALAGSIAWDNEPKGNGNKIEPFSRIQCTVDLLPQDILGYTRFLSSSDAMVFTEGPIFSHFILCDEINLLTPKTQGSFFQVMEEQTVSIEGRTYILPDPFFIIATMNLEGVHLFPLPAPQLDRFMLRVSMGFPDPSTEAEIITMHGKDNSWSNFRPVVTSGELLEWQGLVDEVDIHPEIIQYIVALIRQTRNHPDVHMGASPRAGIKISRLARALAMVRGEEYVTPDLIKEIFIPATAHRIIMHDATRDPGELLNAILDSTPVEKRV